MSLKDMLGLGNQTVSVPAGLRSALAQSTDIDILNYALTLEHLEYAFYRDGVKQFADSDFAFTGRRGLLAYFGAIRNHEKAHVDTLTSVIKSLGGTPVGEAKYNFGYADAAGFIQVAQALENTGVSAYTGAVNQIQAADLKTAAATIATVEARHASYLNLINNTSPFPSAFDEPKSRDQILAIAGPFIVG